jgi:hypothetical protein
MAVRGQNAGEPFLGFRLSATTSDRFFLGPPFTQIQPTLAVGAPVAEPSTVLLLASGFQLEPSESKKSVYLGATVAALAVKNGPRIFPTGSGCSAGQQRSNAS